MDNLYFDMATSDTWVVDIESSGLTRKDFLVGIALYFPDKGRSYYVDIAQQGIVKEVEQFKSLWNELSPRMVGYNVKFDAHFLERSGYKVSSQLEDVQNMVHLVFEDWGNVKFEGEWGNERLKWQAKYWNIPNALDGEASLKEAINRLGKKLDPKKDLWRLMATEVAPYAMSDVRLTWALREKLYPIIEKWDNLSLYQHLTELTPVVYQMEKNGFLLDTSYADREIQTLSAQMDAITSKYPFNLNSPKQLKEILGTDNTDAETLHGIDTPLVHDVLNYRKMSKAVSTYLKKWRNNRDENGFVHGSFNLAGTTTGRLSSSGDAGNLQNIPDRTYTIKRAIVPSEGNVFLAVDYSTLELRLATYVAEVVHGFDHTMSDLFAQGKDLHAYTRDNVGIREIVFGKASDEEIIETLGLSTTVEKHCRFMAKTMNFGLLYGGGRRMLSALLHIDESVAVPLVYGWRDLYPAFPKANAYFTKQALKYRSSPKGDKANFQYVTQPISGRHRKFHLYPTVGHFKNEDDVWELYNPRESEARKAFNAIVQGLGGYLTNASLVAIMKKAEWLRPFAQIHDALEFECPSSRVAEAVAIITTEMTKWDVTPKLEVAFSVGESNWHDMNTLDN